MWKFLGYSVDPDRAEIVGPDGPVHVERYPLEVLIHLARNAERVVSRDELIENVWEGRFVSDTAVSTAIKQARRAVGDDGTTQAVIKTIHGRGFRFVAPTEAPQPARAATASDPMPDMVPEDTPGSGRPSLAILRFQTLDDSDLTRRLADALPAEIISSLSRFGWLHMISRGSSFRFDPASVDLTLAGQQLGARYLGTGTVETSGSTAIVSVEIATADTGAHVWSDSFTTDIADVYQHRTNIVSAISTALELAIPRHEARASRSLDANEFDAWSHFHLGLAHIFRYNKGDNLIAAQHFNAAVERDPEFARAHAGLSLAHWQGAFMNFEADRKELVRLATQSADRAIAIDPDEPFANFNMGRARWLAGDVDEGLVWLDRALTINPNMAQSHYTVGLLSVMNGAPEQTITSAHQALSLSPLDPLLYAMHGSLALSALMRDDMDEAVERSERAARLPNTHFYMALIAAATREVNGDRDLAERWRDKGLAARPGATLAMVEQSFPFQRDEDRKKFFGALKRLGLN